MEKICKNCKYWEIIDNELDTEFKTGRCVSPHVIDGTHLVKRDGIGYSGNDLEFAEDYGCIHFEPKNDVDEVYNRLIKNLVELSQFAKAVENLPDIEMHSICELFDDGDRCDECPIYKVWEEEYRWCFYEEIGGFDFKESLIELIRELENVLESAVYHLRGNHKNHDFDKNK